MTPIGKAPPFESLALIALPGFDGGAVSRKYCVAEPVDVAVFPLHNRVDNSWREKGTE